MKKMGFAAALFLGAAGCTDTANVAQVSRYVASNHMLVYALPEPGSFEVANLPGAGPLEYWCAAADYARTQQNTPVAQRLYIQRGYGESQTRPGQRGVVFGAAAPAGAIEPPKTGFAASIRKEGYNLQVGHAASFCNIDQFAGDW